MGNILKAFFGNYSKRELKRIQPLCDKVLALEEKYKALSDEDLQAQTPALKAPLPGADHRRHRAPAGPHRRDEDR